MLRVDSVLSNNKVYLKDNIFVIDLEDMVGEKYPLYKVYRFLIENQNIVENMDYSGGGFFSFYRLDKYERYVIGDVECYSKHDSCWLFKDNDTYAEFKTDSIYFGICDRTIDFGNGFGIPYRSYVGGKYQINIYSNVMYERTMVIDDRIFEVKTGIRKEFLKRAVLGGKRCT